MAEVNRVPLKQIKAADYNPSQRVEARGILALRKSIEKVGLVYPLAVSKDMRLIDGHRRLEAVRGLGWTEVPVLVVASEADSETVYAEINAVGRRLSGTENLQVWLKEPNAVTARSRRHFENFEERFGRRILAQAAKANAAVNLFRVASSIAAYCDASEDVAFVRKTARWLLQHRCTQLSRSYMQMMQPAKKLHDAVTQGKPLVAHFKASD